MNRHTRWFMAILNGCLMIGLAILGSEEFIPFVRACTHGTLMIDLGIMLGATAVELSLLQRDEARTDGDLIAGMEDEDGLVVALSTPLEEIKKKASVRFKVVHKQMEVREK